MESNKNIIGIMEKALNDVDPRLIDHGKRVAYLVYRVLESQGLFNSKELHDICTLALLHDIGAYKTEEIDRMVAFETTDVWEHSVYGYMFLKYYSPLSSWASILLYHHGESEWVKNLKNPEHQMLAQLIHLCDRADIQSLQDDSNQEFIWYINKNREKMYRDDIVNMYLESELDINKVFDEMESDNEFKDFLYNTPLSAKVTKQYLQMTLYSIYFRNEYKVNRVYGSAHIPASFTKFFKLTKAEREKIIKYNFLKNLEEIELPKKFIRSAKKMDISNMRLDNYNFLEDVHMLNNLFLILYGSEGYKNSCSKDMVIGLLSDLIEQQGLKTSIVALAIAEYDNIDKETRRVKPSVLEMYLTIKKSSTS